jgi:hypothetical protein
MISQPTVRVADDEWQMPSRMLVSGAKPAKASSNPSSVMLFVTVTRRETRRVGFRETRTRESCR